MNKLVSIVILTYNRINVLLSVLEKIYNQNYSNFEIIVINNNSTDDTKILLTQKFPKIKLINLNKNIGVSGLNLGLEAAKGEYILQLDDDSYPEKDAIEKSLQYFEQNDKLGILSLKVNNLRYNYCETETFQTRPKLFNGCGVMFSKKLFSKIGYYNSNIFIYYNELDLTARCYNAGFEVLYVSDINVFHLQSSEARVSKNTNPLYTKFRFYHYYLSYFVFLVTYFNTSKIIKYSIKLFFSNLLSCFATNYWLAFIKAAVVNIYRFPNLYKNRTPLNIETQKFYNNGNFPLLDRFVFVNFEKSLLYKWLKK